MSKAPSAETELRHAKRQIRELQRMLALSNKDMGEYRRRATQAEQAAAEWKTRFDALLKIFPPGALVITTPRAASPDQAPIAT